MKRRFVILAFASLATACTVSINTGDSPSDATEKSLMAADRDFAIATHARGIDGWMSSYVFHGGEIGSTTGRYWVVNRTGADAGKESGHGRYVTMWRRDRDRWLAIMDTGYPDPPVTR